MVTNLNGIYSWTASRVTNTSMAALLLADPNRFYAQFEQAFEPQLLHKTSPNKTKHHVAEDDAGRGNKSVNAGQATGPDGTPSPVLKPSYQQLPSIFADILNMCGSYTV